VPTRGLGVGEEDSKERHEINASLVTKPGDEALTGNDSG